MLVFKAGAILTEGGRRDGLAYLRGLTWPHHNRVALGEQLPLTGSESSSVKSTYYVFSESQALGGENSRIVIWSLLKLKEFM